MHEQHLYTYDQAVEQLRDAARAVAEAELPDELRPIGFQQACAWLSQKNVYATPPPSLVQAAPTMAIPRGRAH